MEAVKLGEFLLVVWKSQTYFGQLYVCLWLLSYLATLIGMEILHSMDNNLNCNYTFKQPNVKLVCPDYDNSPQKYRFTFAIIYGVLTFAIWFLYTAYSVPRLRKFEGMKSLDHFVVSTQRISYNCFPSFSSTL